MEEILKKININQMNDNLNYKDRNIGTVTLIVK